MDSLLVTLAAREIPGLIASHPKAALGLAALYALLEWLWPRLKKIKGDSTPDVLFHVIKAGLSVLKKKG